MSPNHAANIGEGKVTGVVRHPFLDLVDQNQPFGSSIFCNQTFNTPWHRRLIIDADDYLPSGLSGI